MAICTRTRAALAFAIAASFALGERTARGQCETDKVTPGDIQASDRFGWSSAISGDYVVIGADVGDVEQQRVNTGVAYLFQRNGLELVEMEKLSASDAGFNPDRFGSAVAIDGDFLVVGAASGDALFSAAPQSGAAYVFRRNGTDWIEEAKISASDAATFDQFGASVGIAGDVIIVGAPRNDVFTQTDHGAAYVFTRFDNTFPCSANSDCDVVGLSTCSGNVCQGVAWTEKQRLLPPVGSADDLFGGSVAISADRILIGSKGDDDACPQTPTCNSGSAYVFRDDGTNWVFDAKLTASDGAELDSFGEAVAIDGNVAVITALSHDDGASNAGAAYVFRRKNTDWIEEGELLASDAMTSDRLGRSVSVSGNLILVGTRDTDDGGSRSGSAYLFRFDGAGWEQVTKLRALDEARDDRFGFSVALDGDHAVVGAYREDGGGFDSGSAYLFLVGLSEDCDFNNNPDACDLLECDGSPACMDVSPGDGVLDGCQCSASDTTCFDGPSCAAVSCDLDLERCVVEPLAGTCLIGGECIDEQTVNPNNDCEACDPSIDPRGWSARMDGMLCGDDGKPCTDDLCSNGVCTHPDAPLGTPCDDGFFCTDLDFCQAGACGSDSLTQCSEPTPFCDEAVDMCVECTGDTDCADDGLFCNGVEKCVSGSCEHREIPCTESGFVCNEAGDECGCTLDQACDDGLFCTGVEVCFSGECESSGDPCVQVGLVCAEGGRLCVAGAQGRCETDKVTPSDIQRSDRFGWSAAISGDYVVVGADNGDVDESAVDTGVAYVYMRNGLELVEMQKLSASDASFTADRFGSAVAIDGDFLVVGAANGNARFSAAPQSGAAYVFRRDGSTWVEEAKISASDAANGDRFGMAVAVADGIVVVGAPGNIIGAMGVNLRSGTAYLFTRRVNSIPCESNADCEPFDLTTCANNVCTGVAWVEERRFFAPDLSHDDFFGGSVAISGDQISGVWIIVGAKGDDDACPKTPTCNSGSAYVFFKDGVLGNLSFDAKLTPSDGAELDNFGEAVAIEGDVAVVTAWSHDDGALNTGAAYVFRRNGTDWIEEAELLASDAMGSDRFGRSVAISGDLILVGARDTDDGGSRSGSAYLFHFDGTNWSQVAKLRALDEDTNDRFGQSVALEGDHAVIGAYRDDDGGTDSGSAYMFLVGPADDCDRNGNIDVCDLLECDGSPACADVGPADGVLDMCQCSASDPACFDERPCAAVSCDLDIERCVVEPVAGTCLIGGKCIDELTVNPNNDCEACDPTIDPFGWSGRTDTTLCDDGLSCTVDRCRLGRCVNALSPDSCLIGGVCFTGMNPANECETCDPSSDPHDWTTKPDGKACQGDGNDCTDDVCMVGSCAHPNVADQTSCDDGLFCNGADLCMGGQCIAEGNPCPADECDEATGRCLLGACCFGEGICFDAVDGNDCALIEGRFLGDGLTCDGDPDHDLAFGCDDGCPIDGFKTEPLRCGCGMSETDSDLDGVPDCVDVCPGTLDGVPVDADGCEALGACCFRVGVCIDETLAADCAFVGGAHQGAQSTCNVECIFPPGSGDFDDSGLLDLTDVSVWPMCMTGPNRDAVAEGCGVFDFDGDNDVDLTDAKFLQVAFLGIGANADVGDEDPPCE